MEEYYTSKYYSCEQIDERLLQGWYDDLVSAGYGKTKAQFDKELSTVLNEYLANKQSLDGKLDSETASRTYATKEELKITKDDADTWVKATFSVKEVDSGLEVTLNRNPHSPIKFIVPIAVDGENQFGLIHGNDLEQINTNTEDIANLQKEVKKASELTVISLDDIIEVKDILGNTSSDGKLVYDPISNLLLWQVSSLGVITYYRQADLNKLVGTSPKIGRIYACKGETFIGVTGGLHQFIETYADDDVIFGGDAFSQYGPNDQIGGGGAF